MSGRYWLHIVALGGLIGAALAGPSEGQPKAPDHQPEAAQNQPRSPAPAKAAQYDPKEAEPPCEGAKPNESSGSCFTRRQTEASEKQVESARTQTRLSAWQTGFTVFALIAAFVAAWAAWRAAVWAKRAAIYTRFSAKVSRSALRQSKDAFLADQRPWLSLNHSMSPGGYGDFGEGITVSLDCTVTNHGKIPAVGTSIFSRIVINSDRSATEEFREYCEAVSANADEKTGAVVFPGDPVTINTKTYRFKLEIEEDMRARPNPLKKAVAELWLVVRYRFAGSDKAHFTPYRYHLMAGPKIGELESLIDPELLPTQIWLHPFHMHLPPT